MGTTTTRVLFGALLASTAVGLEAAEGPAQRLLEAAKRGDAAQVSALVREGGDPNARDRDGRPALLLAASSGRPEAVRALLRAGASPDHADRSGWTALHQAAEDGDSAVARVLLDAGAAPDLLSRNAGTALDVAERNGQVAIARLLRARGAKGSGKSIGDTVCVRPWKGEGYCGVVAAVEPSRFRLRVREVLGCEQGCTGNESCSGGRGVGGVGGLSSGDVLWVPSSCLTHTGVR